MNKRAYLLTIGILGYVVSLGVAAGQTGATADIQVTVVQGPPAISLPGESGTIILQVTNHGPDVAGVLPSGDEGLFLFSGPVPFAEGIGIAVHFVRPVSDDCVRLSWAVVTPGPGQEPYADYIVYFPPLAPGKSFTCTLEYRVNPFIESFVSTSPLLTEWYSFMLRTTDPNPTNDRRTTAFQFIVPEPIPTLSPAGLTLLALAMVMAFAWVRRLNRG